METIASLIFGSLNRIVCVCVGGGESLLEGEQW